MDPASTARLPAKASTVLSLVAIVGALFGWTAFAVAIQRGNHFNDADPASGPLLLVWMFLGAIAFGAWVVAAIMASIATRRARREGTLGAARGAVVLAVAAPCTWAVEWGLLVVWFGWEVMRGPWTCLA